MPKYYCDYCDIYLKNDSPSERKTHFEGKRHKGNVLDYYQTWTDEQVQKSIDQTTAAYRSGRLPNAPSRTSIPTIVPSWTLPPQPGMLPLGVPLNPAAMMAFMMFRPPPGIFPPASNSKPSHK